MKKLFATGKKVAINQGFGVQTFGTVVSFDAKTKNKMGFKGNYKIMITGGLDCFKRPAKVGEIVNVLHSHVVTVSE
jgi:hypothetical protein